MNQEEKKKSSEIFLWAKSITEFFQKQLTKITLPDYLSFTIYAIIIGIVAGLAAVLFHNSIDFFNKIFFEQTAEGLYFLGAAAVIVLPAIGMLIQAYMIRLAPDIAAKKGVPEVIKSVSLKGGYIPLKTTIFHFFAPVICIGSGGTVGPEGPAAQLGGGVSSKVCQLIGLSDSRRRVFTAAGAGAAIAAIFNTPLGGVFFAIELILLNDFKAPTLSAVILASVTASTISRELLGNESVFMFASPETGSYHYLYMYAVLGLIAGLASVLYLRYNNSTSHFLKKKMLDKGVPQWLLMIIVGLLVGISGYFFKDIFGIGYSAINNILSGQHIWKVVLILFGLKFLLVPLIINSGGFGGMFAPSLFMGACVGFLFATAANSFLGMELDTTTYILVGMGAMLGGINTIPITAILIIFEMTQEYSFILPLMLAVIVSTTFTRIILKSSVHVQHLEAQGYQVYEGREANLLKRILIRNIDIKPLNIIHEKTKLTELIGKMIQSPGGSFYTVNDREEITAVITEVELRPIMTEYENVKDFLVANDIANPQFVTVTPDDDLDHVIRLFGKVNVDCIPVISNKVESKIIGGIYRQEVLSIYNRETLKLNLPEGLSDELKTLGNSGGTSTVAKGYSIAEITVDTNLAGQSLADLKIRSSYGLEVLMIKHPQDLFDDSESNELIISADPNYKLKWGDKLVVFGKDENIARFKKI
ncbi:MAG TPA: chloride channel protein [Ignavibacteriaceae bacterium]|nr:chloride channel protein [Ignavibacteriaceae bacterium]